MKRRCYDKKNKSYKDYGGRGIFVQESWLKDYVKFKDYVSSLINFKESLLGINGLYIDRIDVNDGYKEGNIRWVGANIQARNKRMQHNNTSGYVGIRYVDKYKKFVANISVNNKRIHIGYFNCIEVAYTARIKYIKDHKLKGYNTTNKK